MAKCIVCNTNERAAGDDCFCYQCRKAAQDKQKETVNVDGYIPAGTVCHRHPSALAYWIARRPQQDLERALCHHCYRAEFETLVGNGWTIEGSPCSCNCETCKTRDAAA